MMKKIFCILAVFMMIASNCFAMTMQQPVKVGEVSGYTSKDGKYRFMGHEVKGAKILKATSSKVKKVYSSGIFKYGESLYFHCSKNENSNFGSKNITNTVGMYVAEGETRIYQIKNDLGIELYMLLTDTGGGGSTDVIGTTKNGKWVKYFHLSNWDALKQFGIRAYFNMPFTAGDTIVISYCGDGSRKNIGELRYKWDDKAQWFGIEQVVY